MDTETYNKEHAHNKEIIDKKSLINELICWRTGLDDVISLVCIKFSIFVVFIQITALWLINNWSKTSIVIR